MNSAPVSDPLVLYREASRISSGLRNFCEINTKAHLNALSEDELSRCVDFYSDTLYSLSKLSDQIKKIEKDFACPVGLLAEYESLHHAVTGDLKISATFEDRCREVLMTRKEELQSALMNIRQRERLSAYLQSPLYEPEQLYYERYD